jgi:hypothetical protein
MRISSSEGRTKEGERVPAATWSSGRVMALTVTEVLSARGWRDSTSAMKCSVEVPGLWNTSNVYMESLLSQRMAHACVYGLREEMRSLDSRKTGSRLSRRKAKGSAEHVVRGVKDGRDDGVKLLAVYGPRALRVRPRARDTGEEVVREVGELLLLGAELRPSGGGETEKDCAVAHTAGRVRHDDLKG